MLSIKQRKYSVICYFFSPNYERNVDSNGLEFLFEEKREYNFAYSHLTFSQVLSVLGNLSEESILELTDIKIEEEEEEDIYPF